MYKKIASTASTIFIKGHYSTLLDTERVPHLTRDSSGIIIFIAVTDNGIFEVLDFGQRSAEVSQLHFIIIVVIVSRKVS